MLWFAVLARKGSKREWVWPTQFHSKPILSFVPEKVTHKVMEILQRACKDAQNSPS